MFYETHLESNAHKLLTLKVYCQEKLFVYIILIYSLCTSITRRSVWFLTPSWMPCSLSYCILRVTAKFNNSTSGKRSSIIIGFFEFTKQVIFARTRIRRLGWVWQSFVSQPYSSIMCCTSSQRSGHALLCSNRDSLL